MALTFACNDSATPPQRDMPVVRETMTDAESLRQVAKNYFPIRGCLDVATDIATQAGPRSISCTTSDQGKAIACADSAVRQRAPFTLLSGGWGMDSFISNAVVGRPGGSAVFYYADTMGPAFKGTCLGQNVLSSSEGWPACRHQLTDRVDLRTCRPYEERWPLRYEETWTADCARAADRSAQQGSVRLIHRVPLVPDLERWNLRCRRFVPSFELIIDRTGSVQCARIVSFTNRDIPPPPGLYEQMKKNLMRWKFAPPTLHGQPVEVRWGMQDNPVCDQDTR